MSGSAQGLWLDRLAESLREHEDRKTSIQAYPPRYEVLGEISRGGMGIIYRAWDPQLGRNVALKVLRAEEGRGAEVHERFQREAQLAAGLHHPHIVQIFDTGTWNGQDYIAMQLIEGTTLDQAKIDRKQALAAIRDAARALHYAHEQGIVHRDVKPTNLLLETSGRVYVTDFGVARQAVASSTITSPGTIVGTPAYMSPEQAQGLATDARSDVYSLGATLYELVTGRSPYDNDDPVAVVEAVRSAAPLPPRKRAPDLSKNVEAIILGAMERAREDRYASASELADDIDRYLRGERPLRRARGVTYRVRREFVRNPWRSWAAILFCALLLTAGITLGYVIRGYLYLNRARQTREPELQKHYYRIAERWFPEAGQELARIQREEDRRLALEREQKQRKKEAETQANLRGEVHESMRRIAVAETDANARKYLDEGKLQNARKEIDSLRSPAPEKYAELLIKLRRAEFDSGVEQLAALALKPEEAAFEALYGTLSGPQYEAQKDAAFRLSKPVFQLALRQKELQKLAEALKGFDRAEALGLQEARLYEQRGLILLELQQWEQAQRDLSLLRQHSEIGTVFPAPFAQLPYREGHQALIDRNWDGAIQKFETALLYDRKHAPAYHDRGLARYHASGLAREAMEQDLKEALANLPSLVPDPQYRDVVLAFVRSEAGIHWKTGKPEDRRPIWNRCIYWLSQILERTAPDDPELLLERSRMQRRLGNLPLALEDAGRSLRRRPTQDGYLTAGILSFLKVSPVTKDESLVKEAIGYFDQAEQLGPRNSRVYYWRGICRRLLGDRELDAAFEDLKAADDPARIPSHLYLQLARTSLDLFAKDKDPKRWLEAAEFAERAVSNAENLSEEEFVGGLFESQKRSRAEAILMLSRDAHLARGQARFEAKDYATCSEECSAALRLDPQFASAFLWKGYARCNESNHKDAREDFRQAVRYSTHAAEKENASLWLSRCLKHSKD